MTQLFESTNFPLFSISTHLFIYPPNTLGSLGTSHHFLPLHITTKQKPQVCEGQTAKVAREASKAMGKTVKVTNTAGFSNQNSNSKYSCLRDSIAWINTKTGASRVELDIVAVWCMK